MYKARHFTSEPTKNREIKKYIGDLASTDDRIRLNALQTLLKTTDTKVDWVYEAWDLLLDKLGSENSYQRSIGILMLCNLAKSDTEDRLRHSLDRLLAHTRDEKFITERQCVQNIWKTAATNRANREKVLKHLEEQFVDCAGEKHYNLLRLDIIQSMVALYKWEGDSELLRRAQSLIAQEPEAKYRKQYQALLRTN